MRPEMIMFIVGVILMVLIFIHAIADVIIGIKHDIDNGVWKGMFK